MYIINYGLVCIASVSLTVLVADGLVVEAPYMLAILTGAGVTIGVLFKLLIASKDREYAMVIQALKVTQDREMKDKEIALRQEESQKKSYKEIAIEAVRSATANTDYWQQQQGKPPMLPIAPVVPESHSPPTMQQSESATIQTLRAQMEALKLATGQPPRVEGPDGPISPPPHASITTPSTKGTAIIEVPALPVLLVPKTDEELVPNAREGMAPHDFVDKRVADQVETEKHRRERERLAPPGPPEPLN